MTTATSRAATSGTLPESATVLPESQLVRMAGWLPQGGTLSEEEWGPRHRVISAVLWLHVPFIAIIGLANGRSLLELGLNSGVIALCAAVAHLLTGRAAKSAVVSLGLLFSSAALVHLTGGLTEAHFHFFVMLGLVALYQEWFPYLLSVTFVLLHHSIIGLIWPEEVFATAVEQRKPLLWAIVHASFVLGQIIVQVTVWKFLELSQQRVAKLEREQVELRAVNAELELDKEKRHREHLQDAVYKLAHWHDLNPNPDLK